jgi:hypothetical protein
MACMEIEAHQEDHGHFAPAGIKHGWKTFNSAVRLLDISSKT